MGGGFEPGVEFVQFDPRALVVGELKVGFPCSQGRVARLVDGGAYDNAGLEPVDDLPQAFLVALNAGGLFRTGPGRLEAFWLPSVARGRKLAA